MKKKIFAMILSVLMLLPACADFLPSFGSEGVDSVTQSSQGGPSSDNDNSQESSYADQDKEHRDGNDDGICDDCKTSVIEDVVFFSFNDLHGKFDDTEANEGVDEISTFIKQVKMQYENTILLSSGDMWQGASASNLTKGNIITEWMNDMEFVSMTLGNHEYDWGEEYIRNNLALAQFPFLAINVYDNNTDQLVDYCQPSVMVENGGLKIGIIGAIGDCHSSISGEHNSGFYFKTGSALTALVKAESEKLRADGADFIVYSIHDDNSAYDESLSNGYVDLVFEGHTHQQYTITDSKGVYHMQAGGDNDGISCMAIKLNSVTGSFSVEEVGFIAISDYSHLEDDPIVETLLAKYADQIALAGRVLGYNERYRSSNEILQTCAQLYYEAGLERWGTKYDIALGGGFMSARSPYNLQVGTVIYGDLQNILPFDNQLVLCSIKGSDLRSKFFETSNSRYYIAYGDYGANIKDNIQNNKTYYLVTDTYSSTYAPNNLTEIERYDANVFARDLLAKYIEAGGFGKMPTEETITLTSIPMIHQLGSQLADNAETSDYYFVKGKIVSFDTNSYATIYGNFTIEDEEGNQLYVYGLYDRTGVRFDSMANQPKVGDTVILRSVIKKYVNNNTKETKVEFISATLWSIE